MKPSLFFNSPHRLRTLRRLAEIAAYIVLPLLLLFGRGPGTHEQWLADSWNLGHVLLFFIWTLSLLRRLKRRWPQHSPLALVTATFFIMLLLGWLIEVLQAQFGRAYSLQDLWLDVCGTVIALTWSTVWRQFGSRPTLIARLLSSLLLLVISYDWILSSSDRLIAWQQFPLLFSPETPLVKQRLSGSTVADIRQGEQQYEGWLKVTFSTARYSNLSLTQMEGDWRDYETLVMKWHNPNPTEMDLRCRIHDRHHQQRYTDRFNRHYRLTPGLNTLRIPLIAVERAPRGRKMDMKNIRNLLCFSHRLAQPQVLYLGQVLLEPSQS